MARVWKAPSGGSKCTGGDITRSEWAQEATSLALNLCSTSYTHSLPLACVCTDAQSLSCAQLFATPWTVACQSSLSMGFSRQEYWSGFPLPMTSGQFLSLSLLIGEGNGTPLQYSCLENPMDGGAWKAAVRGVAEGQTQLSDFTFTFHFHTLEKEMATHSSVLVWRIPGTAEPGGLPSMGSHRVGHD